MTKEYLKLNKIGTRLMGGILGKLIVDTLISKAKSDITIIIDCKGITYIGDDLVWGGKMTWKDKCITDPEITSNLTISIINATPFVLGKLSQFFNTTTF